MESRDAGKEVPAKGPDILIKNRTDNISLLIDVAIPSDRNATQKGAEKKSKYEYFKYRNSANVEHEMLRHTSNYWCH